MALRSPWLAAAVAAVVMGLLGLHMVPEVSAAGSALGVFDNCVNDVGECLTQRLQVGQYPHCTDCSMFAKCNGASSSLLQCPSGLLYDVTLGVCNYIGQAECGTTSSQASTTSQASTIYMASNTSPASLTSQTSLASSTSPTSLTSLTSLTSPTSPTSQTSPTSPTSQTSPTSPTSITSPTSLTSPIGSTGLTSPYMPTMVTATTSPTTRSNTLQVFTECLTSVDQCVAARKPIGQYPLCSDCSAFVKCNGPSSAEIPCGPGTEYDHVLGVCNHIGLANCFTRRK